MRVEQVKRIGIIGCGTFGTTLAAAAAPKYEVVVKRRDVSKGLAEEAIKRISRCFPSMVKRNTLKEDQIETAISHISITDDFNDLKDCQVIFDAVPEILELKVANLSQLNKICPQEVIFLGVGPAGVSTTGMAAGSGRPDRVMTAHFFTPVHIWNFVELAPALQTSQETIDFTEAFIKEGLGKTVIKVKDAPGLIQDYFLHAYFNHAVKLLEAGVATVEDIDTVVKAGFGVRLGPFELMDHLGISVYGMKTIYERTHNAAFAPHPLMIKLIEAGYKGRAVGKGWYVWDEQGKKTGMNKLL